MNWWLMFLDGILSGTMASAITLWQCNKELATWKKSFKVVERANAKNRETIASLIYSNNELLSLNERLLNKEN